MAEPHSPRRPCVLHAAQYPWLVVVAPGGRQCGGSKHFLTEGLYRLWPPLPSCSQLMGCQCYGVGGGWLVLGAASVSITQCWGLTSDAAVPAQHGSDPSTLSLPNQGGFLHCWSLFKVKRHLLSIGKVTQKAGTGLLGHSWGFGLLRVYNRTPPVGKNELQEHTTAQVIVLGNWTTKTGHRLPQTGRSNNLYYVTVILERGAV